MPDYTAPTKDMLFVLNDVLKISTLDIPGYDELEADFTAAVLNECGKLSAKGHTLAGSCPYLEFSQFKCRVGQ